MTGEKAQNELQLHGHILGKDTAEKRRAKPASQDAVLSSTGEKAQNELELAGKDLAEKQRAKPASRDVALSSTGEKVQNKLQLQGHILGKIRSSWSDTQEKELLDAAAGARIDKGFRALHRF